MSTQTSKTNNNKQTNNDKQTNNKKQTIDNKNILKCVLRRRIPLEMVNAQLSMKWMQFLQTVEPNITEWNVMFIMYAHIKYHNITKCY